MKCAVWFLSVPVRTSMYQYVLVCTMNRLNLSSFEIQLRHIVSHAKELYSLYLISSDSFWMSQETTCLLECTYWYVPVHTSTYDREILVLPCTRCTGFQMLGPFSGADARSLCKAVVSCRERKIWSSEKNKILTFCLFLPEQKDQSL